MKDSIHVSKENYLKAILEAEAEGRQVIPAMLAHWLEVSAPAVTMALKRLKRDGYVEVGEDGIVRLTVTHVGLADDEARRAVSHGWPAVLSNLKSLLETGHVLPQSPWTMARP